MFFFFLSHYFYFIEIEILKKYRMKRVYKREKKLVFISLIAGGKNLGKKQLLSVFNENDVTNIE